MSLPRPTGPLAAWRDLRAFFSNVGGHVWIAAGLALAITAFIIFGFWHDSRFQQQPTIIYVQNWPANRTDAEIIADQKKASAEKHKAEAERRAEFQRLQKATSWL